ncbi:MAG: nucleoside-diphosphate sugar epimerase, partial [Bacteroidota bacterium]|nr:nucleoside-diphosphate sugar epimerase [Bacteroidota bacterium]
RFLLIGENINYKELFTVASAAFGTSPPSIRLSPTVLQIGWRAERFRTLLFGGTPFVTRSTAHSAIISRKYSNTKVRRTLGFEFRSAKEALENVASYLEGARR